MKYELRNKNKNKGFTLIEVMVATTIFMIVMLMGVGALLVSSNSAKKSEALRSAMDNVSFAVEGMTRALRMGSNFYCAPDEGLSLPSVRNADCFPDGGTAIAFTPAEKSTSDTSYEWHDNLDGSLDSGTPTASTHSLRKCSVAEGCVDLTSLSTGWR